MLLHGIQIICVKNIWIGSIRTMEKVMTDPIRILHVVTIMNRGGLETMLMNYYRHIDRSRIQFDFMVHRHERGTYDDEIESLGGRIFRMHPIHPKYFLSYFKELAQFFRMHKEYQIVHAHLDTLSTFVLRAAHKSGVPVRIAHSHNTSFPDKGLRKLFKLYSRRHLNKECTHFFACGISAGKFLFGDAIVDSKQLIVMNNAIDTYKFKFNESIRKLVRAKLEIEDKFVIGHVGRFAYQKNHEFIIDVFSEIVNTGCNAKLLLIGEGELQNTIETKVQLMGLSDKVIFAGGVSNVNAYMMAMDAFLFPSLFEGLPVTIIEAQAAGLPIVLSSSITKEILLTPTVTMVDITEPLSIWRDAVCKYSNFNRNNNYNEIIYGLYDIKRNAKNLERFYENVILA